MKRGHSPDHTRQIKALKFEDRIELRRHWYNNHGWLMLPVAIVCNGAALTHAYYVSGNEGDTVGAIRAGLLLLLALALAYVTLAHTLNTIRVEIEDQHLLITAAPLPLRLPFRCHIADIARVHVAHTDRTDIYGRALYNIDIHLRDGTHRTVFEELNYRVDADFLSSELEFILGLNENEPRKEKNA